MINFGILGFGAWGSALASILSHNQQKVTIWARESQLVERFAKDQKNPYYLPFLPEYQFSPALQLTNQLANLAVCDVVLLAISAQNMKEVLHLYKPYIHKKARLIICAKGLAQPQGLFMHEIIEEVFLDKHPVYVLSGPSFAREVLLKQPTALVLAGPLAHIEDIKHAFTNEYIHISITDDVKGIEILGAAKNVYAVASGMLHGLGYEVNTQALFLTKAFNELKHLLRHLGGCDASCDMAAGIGDFILTNISEQSRNYRLGLAYAAQDQLAITSLHTQAEGYMTARSFYQLIEKHQLNLPLLSAIYGILHEGADLQQLVPSLF